MLLLGLSSGFRGGGDLQTQATGHLIPYSQTFFFVFDWLMSPREVWITPQKHSASELDGQTIDMDVMERKPNRALYKTQGFGRIRIQYHPKTSGKVCIWVMLDDGERAMDDIDEDNVVLHPDQSKARYLCKPPPYNSGEDRSDR